MPHGEVCVRGTIAVGVFGWVLGSGCFRPPAAANQRVEQVRAMGAEAQQALDAVEERLVGGRALVSHWTELAARHHAVSEVACVNQNAHLMEMAVHLERQQQKLIAGHRWRELGAQGGPKLGRVRGQDEE